jgi:UDPglucose 6-dehydrogenase
MNITVIGLGYVGLVTAVSFANMGYRVHGIDINKKTIKKINSGSSPIYEKGINELIEKYLNKSFDVSSTYSNVKLLESDVIFLCLPTPSQKSGKPNDSFLVNATNTLIQKKISNVKALIIKSTVAPGTNEKLRNIFLKQKIDLPIISNPEFLREGSAIYDFNYPDRIIAGIRQNKEKRVIESIYRPVSRKKNKIIFTSPEEAEIIKYASNAMLANKISFMNEVSMICDITNSDINNIRIGIGADNRIGSDFLYAGLGYGGSCFPKDIEALKWYKKKYGLKTGLIEATAKINKNQIPRIIKKMQDFYGSKLIEKKIAVLGLSFKPGTDDIRESPAIQFIKVLAPLVQKVIAYDPQAISNTKNILSIKNISYVKTKKAALKNIDSIVIATEWKEFWNYDDEELSKIKDKVIFDTRNILNKAELQKSGFKHIGL